MASGGADRIEQDLTWDDLMAPMVDPDPDSEMEDALLSYAHRKAAEDGAERFAAEWRRREEEDEENLPARQALYSKLRPLPARDEGVVDAEVEANVVNEGPVSLGLRPEPRAPVEAAPPVAAVEPEPAPAPEPEPEPAATPPVAEPVAVAEPTPVAEPAPEPVAAPIVDAPPLAERILAAVESTPAPQPAPEPQAAPVVAASQQPDWTLAQVKTVTAPPLRHPTVPRPPVTEEPEPATRKERRRKRKHERDEPPAAPHPMFTAGEWARMSPGARRLYGMDDAPPS